MTRKKWEPQTAITPALLKTREKRKWQIALRRYVLERNISADYAPYFGLDIDQMRRWFECQFPSGIGWQHFGELWQFEHVLPVTCFDFTSEDELRICWNFINLRVEVLQDTEKGSRQDSLIARRYFTKLLEQTGYPVCAQLLEKIRQMESTDDTSTRAQADFIIANQTYLETVGKFGTYEFEQVNRGRPVREVQEEADFLRKYQ
jgi:hypothetical protein